MKLTRFFFAFFFIFPDREAFRHVIKNAKTNKKASPPGGLFIDNKKATL